MAFINIFDYKKYFSSKGDSNVARIGHVNKLASRVTSPVAVTQLTSNTTDVTVNSYSGVITMYGPLSPGAPTTYDFVVNNSVITADSVIMLTAQYGAALDAADTIVMGVTNLIDGSFKIVVRSSGSTAPNAIKIHFLVIS